MADRTTDDDFAREHETMKSALVAIGQMPDESNEWHAVELYSEAREKAVAALESIGVHLP